PSDVMEIIQPMRVYQEGKREIKGMELEALEDFYPLSEIWQGVPEAFAMIATRKIRFSHQGDSDGGLIRVDFDYLQLLAAIAKDANQVLIPLEFRPVMADWIAFLILLDKDDSKAKDIGAMAKGGLMGMAKENRRRSSQISDDYGAIQTRPTNIPSRRFPLRTTGGRIIGW
ncbi:MAG: hypothetical protein L0Y56_04255, partial [Nitrospira sp.]|nr:hypothetical protein [Nitrospira sp.]